MTLARNNADLKATVDLKSTTASPTFTGTPAAPTANAGTSTTQLATTAFASTGIANLIDSSPAALNTLNELAAAMGDDASFSTTVTNNIAAKVAKSGDTMTGNLIVNANVGMDVTPEAWHSSETVLRVGPRNALWSDSANLFLTNNLYDDGTNKYIATALASKYVQSAGVHSWYTAPSGSANAAITWTERMRITDIGNVGIGVDPASKLHIKGTAPSIYLTSDATQQANSGKIRFSEHAAGTNDYFEIYHDGSANVFKIESDYVSNNLVIDRGTGNVGIGASPLVTHADKTSLTVGGTGFLACDTAVGANKMLLLLQNGYLNTSGNWVRVSEDEATLYQQYAGKHIFHTVGSASVGTNITWDERMVITNDGNVGIGTDGSIWKFGVKASDAAGTFYIHVTNGQIYSQPTYDGTTSNYGTNMYVHSDGSMYRVTSSRKYKTNIKDYSKGLSYLEKVRPVTFKGTGRVDGDGETAGFIAEEISEAGLDEMVERGADGKEIESINYNGMIALLAKSVQELSTKVTALENA